MKRLLLPWLYCDFENPHLFILENYAMMIWSSGDRIVSDQLIRIVLWK